MPPKKRNAVELFRSVGIKVERISSQDDLKSKSWIKPSQDKKGMIRLETKNA